VRFRGGRGSGSLLPVPAVPPIPSEQEGSTMKFENIEDYKVGDIYFVVGRIRSEEMATGGTGPVFYAAAFFEDTLRKGQGMYGDSAASATAALFSKSKP
jgi:hypothetical protein